MVVKYEKGKALKNAISHMQAIILIALCKPDIVYK